MESTKRLTAYEVFVEACLNRLQLYCPEGEDFEIYCNSVWFQLAPEKKHLFETQAAWENENHLPPDPHSLLRTANNMMQAPIIASLKEQSGKRKATQETKASSSAKKRLNNRAPKTMAGMLSKEQATQLAECIFVKLDLIAHYSNFNPQNPRPSAMPTGIKATFSEALVGILENVEKECDRMLEIIHSHRDQMDERAVHTLSILDTFIANSTLGVKEKCFGSRLSVSTALTRVLRYWTEITGMLAKGSLLQLTTPPQHQTKIGRIYCAWFKKYWELLV